MFARAPGPSSDELLKSTPYLAVERTLLIWDKENKTEDFIREARFEQANQTFGFVVPTPTKPEVFAVKDAPFERLARKMPFQEAASTGRGMGAIEGSGGGKGALDLPEPPVLVLAQQRIGSFTAFTLQASEAGAFDKWLSDNGFAVPDEAKAWLKHYIDLKFYFVAFKYDGKPGATKGMTSETVRIRFATPKPYYPYMDATNPKGSDLLRSRLLVGWTVTREAMVDVSATSMKDPRWSRAWARSPAFSSNAKEVAEALGSELAAIAPKADTLIVAPFRDEKRSREGYGDVLLVPAGKSEIFTPQDKEAHRFLLGVVDPVLMGEKGSDVRVTIPESELPQDAGPPAPSSSSSTSESKKGGCSIGATGANPSFGSFFWLIGIAVFVRRRPWLLSLVLCACKKPESGVTNDAASSASAAIEIAPPAPTTRPMTSAERETMAFDVMMGEVPPGGIGRELGEHPAVSTVITISDVKTDGPTLTDADRILATLRPRFKACYSRALEMKPALAQLTTLTMRATIDANGEVSAAKAEPEVTTLSTCVTTAFRRALFNPPEAMKVTKLTFKVAFEMPLLQPKK